MVEVPSRHRSGTVDENTKMEITLANIKFYKNLLIFENLNYKIHPL